MDVLTDRIGRRIDLKIIQVEIARNQVGRVKDHALPDCAQEQRLRGASPKSSVSFYVLFQDGEAGLRIMPARFVDRHIHLDIERRDTCESSRHARHPSHR